MHPRRGRWASHLKTPVKLTFKGEPLWFFPTIKTSAISIFRCKSAHIHGGHEVDVGDLTAVCHRNACTAGPAAGCGMVYGEWLGSFVYDRDEMTLGRELRKVKVIMSNYERVIMSPAKFRASK